MEINLKILYLRFRNLILYGIIGGFCALLDLGIYTLLCHYEILPYLWANVISIHCGILTSFLLNRTFNLNKYELKEIQRIGDKIVYEIVGLRQ